MKSHERESEAHAMNTSILCITLGRFMKLSHKRTEELGIAALLHDVGEVKIPVELIRGGSNTPEQTELVKRHTEFGAKILRDTDEIPDSAVDVAYCHHEQVDGKGYPRGLRADEISLFAKIVAIVDTYDNLTRGNEERSISATEAMRYLYLYRDKFFDGALIEVFIKCLGIYPVGSLIELETGDIGIVISVQPGELLHPKLLMIMGRDKKPYDKPKIMNLALFAKEEPGKYGVKQVLDPDAYGIDMRSYLLSESLL
jgi:HD-GYP domain-containing protein (c-di-GMP phosphodiesterase class II)